MSDNQWLSLLCWGAVLAAIGLLVWMVSKTFSGFRGVYLTEHFLVVDTFAAKERIPLDRIEFERIQILDYRGSSPLRPKKRISGSSGMREGLYYLRNGDRAYVSLRGSAPVLYIPAGRKSAILMRTDDPAALICGLVERRPEHRDVLHPSLDPWLCPESVIDLGSDPLY